MSEDRWHSKQRKTKGDQDKRDNVPNRRLRPTRSPVDDFRRGRHWPSLPAGWCRVLSQLLPVVAVPREDLYCVSIDEVPWRFVVGHCCHTSCGGDGRRVELFPASGRIPLPRLAQDHVRDRGNSHRIKPKSRDRHRTPGRPLAARAGGQASKGHASTGRRRLDADAGVRHTTCGRDRNQNSQGQSMMHCQCYGAPELNDSYIAADSGD